MPADWLYLASLATRDALWCQHYGLDSTADECAVRALYFMACAMAGAVRPCDEPAGTDPSTPPASPPGPREAP